MRKLIASVALAGVALALSGCVAYGGAPYGAVGVYGASPYYGSSVYVDGHSGRYYGNRDRDGDGVSNRHDSYPNDPRRR